MCYTDESRYHSENWLLPISLYLAIRAPRVLCVAKHTLSAIIDMSMCSFIHKPRYLYLLQYRITSKNSASLIFRHPSLFGEGNPKNCTLTQAHFRHLALARVHFSSAEMDTARSSKRRRLTDYFTKLPSILQNHSISRPDLGGTSLLAYRVIHPVQSKDRDVAPRLLLSRLVEAVSRLVEAVSRLVEAVGRLVEARRVAILNQHRDPHRGRRPSRLSWGFPLSCRAMNRSSTCGSHTARYT